MSDATRSVLDEQELDAKLGELERQRAWSPRLVSKLENLIRAGDDWQLFRVNPYAFAPAIAPHIAAEKASVVINLDTIAQAYLQLTTLADVVIVEGAGGFFVPLNQTETLAELALQLNIPIILVVGMRLGCINHALLTVEAIQARGLSLQGWVANQIDPDFDMFEENISSLQQRIAAPCLSVVRWQGTLNLTAFI